jgi:hypothetical protein
MPLTKKGNDIMKSMQRTYGGKKGEQVFYASRNAGKITGVEKKAQGGSGKGGNPGQWSARKAQMLASAYKKAGGGYKS